MAGKATFAFKAGEREAVLVVEGEPGEIVEVTVEGFLEPGCPYWLDEEAGDRITEGVWHADRIPVPVPADGRGVYTLHRDDAGEVA